ncbi:MAG: biotin/lipoyl-binding protein [Candidatus Yonathbacteria bacterium]|nr:biotin/lipoyl-binding protein [Candidatus Yonathbacteria bacterium]
MRKIFYYLLVIVLAGGAVVSFWVWERYFKTEAPRFLTFPVMKGDIQEVVKVRGEVVPQKDFALEFPFSGTVEKVFVVDGQEVKQGDPLLLLETTNALLELKTAEVMLVQGKASLDKLIAGPVKENLRISETNEENARTALLEAGRNLADKLHEAYTASDDAIRNKVDQFFDNPRTANPQVRFLTADSQLKSDIEFERAKMETTLKSWESLIGLSAEIAQNNIDQAKSFLDKVALAINSATANSNVSQTMLDTWRSNTALARTNVNTAIAGLSAAREKLKTAESNLALAEDELALKRAKVRTEDVRIAEAKVEEIESQIALIKEKIKKSTLSAPVSARIVVVGVERGEVAKPGQTVITLATTGHKIQADISELEIGKIKEGDLKGQAYGASGNEVSIRFDAFPGRTLAGKVVSVDAKEIIKEGDKYYRANIYLDPHGAEIRSGMSADLTILVSSRNNVLKIPELAVRKKEGNTFVTVLEDGKQKEVSIETGISDGESIEIVKGLTQGQTVTVLAD